jgi:dihydrofolate synthase / folylpolyglutamate synthase
VQRPAVPTPSPPILTRLTHLHPKLIDLSLGRIERLLDRLGRPQDRLPPVVHVAGTNGKGSTVAFLRAILEAAGRAVHAYTSPHLVRFTERIVVAGREIDDGELAEILAECEAANGGEPITFFEITTAAAFLAFTRAPADATLLETGLGGRLDATNVVAAPAVTAITPVSLDHQEFLGKTLVAIASEKAGILKPGVPCVLAAQAADASRVIRERAAEVGAPLLEEGRDWSAELEENGLRFRVTRKVLTEARTKGGSEVARAGHGAIELPAPGLAGAHQRQNAGLAVACALQLGPRFGVDEAAIGRGLAAVRWPARLQPLRPGPLASLLPDGWELWLDGGHNPGAADVLTRHLQGWRDRPCHLVFGMLRSKDADAFLAQLAPHVASLAAVAIPGEPHSLDAEEACAVAHRRGIAAHPAPSVAEALRLLGGGARSGMSASACAPARVLICGSLYLAGIVLAENGEG